MGYNLITESLLKGKDSHLNLQSKYQAETKWTKHLRLWRRFLFRDFFSSIFEHDFLQIFPLNFKELWTKTCIWIIDPPKTSIFEVFESLLTI